jgi:hypothetical protein
VERIGVPSVLVHHDSQDKQRALFGLNADAIAARVTQYFAKSASRV